MGLSPLAVLQSVMVWMEPYLIGLHATSTKRQYPPLDKGEADDYTASVYNEMPLKQGWPLRSDMSDIDLTVLLSSNRNQSGLLVVKERGSGKVLDTFETLGRGSQGPGDTQMTIDGNTPTGEYEVKQMEDTADWNQSSYGPHGALLLRPVSGNALAAEKIAKRKGILVHGGNPGANGYWRGAGELRATNGCLRLRNEDVENLVNLLFEASNDSQSNQCKTIKVRLTVTDYNASFDRPQRVSPALNKCAFRSKSSAP